MMLLLIQSILASFLVIGGMVVVSTLGVFVLVGIMLIIEQLMKAILKLFKRGIK